jgi:hypothetical protein
MAPKKEEVIEVTNEATMYVISSSIGSLISSSIGSLILLVRA